MDSKSPIACPACEAGLELVWDVQSKKTVHLRGLGTFACKRIEARATLADAQAKCPGRRHRDHVVAACEGACCTACGGPIDVSAECRCG